MTTFETYKERKAFIEELRQQWKTLWLERIDDKVKAEGISNRNYSQLFVERGTVIMATRKYRPPDFYEIVKQHLDPNKDTSDNMLPSPTQGGWGKFVRSSILQTRHSLAGRSRNYYPIEQNRKASQQLKKCGRGWLHFSRRAN